MTGILISIVSSKVFHGYVTIGLCICFAGALLFYLKAPGGPREFFAKTHHVMVWCFIACLAVGMVFLWLPVIMAILITALATKEKRQEKKPPRRCSQAE